MPGKNVSGTPASIRESLKKATTEMLVLFLLQQKPMYTYEMMATVERLSGGGIQFNTLYQAIYRLQGFKYIETISVRQVNIEYNAIVVVKSDAFSSRTKSLGRIIQVSLFGCKIFQTF